MDYGKIILEVLNDWVYNVENQAGTKLNVIDAEDIPDIIEEIIEKIETK